LFYFYKIRWRVSISILIFGIVVILIKHNNNVLGWYSHYTLTEMGKSKIFSFKSSRSYSSQTPSQVKSSRGWSKKFSSRVKSSFVLKNRSQKSSQVMSLKIISHKSKFKSSHLLSFFNWVKFDRIQISSGRY